MNNDIDKLPLAKDWYVCHNCTFHIKDRDNGDRCGNPYRAAYDTYPYICNIKQRYDV